MSTSGFTWIALHKWLVDFIKVRRNRQQELIDLLSELGIRGLHDEYKQGKRVPLREIDPFSFFCYLYKHGPKERLSLLDKIAEKFNLPKPQDQNGIPKVNPMQVCMFPFGYQRTNNEINRLWDFFEAALDDTIDDELFTDVLAVQYTGKAKITEGLFNILPEKYLPINGPVKEFLKTRYGVDPGFTTWKDYQNLLYSIKEQQDAPFYELSFESWLWGMQQREDNTVNDDGAGSRKYWVFQCNPDFFDLVDALQQKTLHDWSVSAHGKSMQVGDKAIIYMSGKQAGIYALAELTSTPYPMSPERDNNWSRAEEFEYKVAIKVTHDLSAKPISKQQISEMSALAAFKGGNQGTNFRSSKQEYEAVMSIVKSTSNVHYWLYAPGEKANRWEEFYAAGEMAIAWDNLGDLSRY
ncbi:MAG: EVE domain-containing protein, partial [Ignavibacteria bacterium]